VFDFDFGSGVKRLQAIKPASMTRFEPDGIVGGLGIRYGTKGRPSFTLAYRLGGEQRRVKLGMWWDGDGDPPRGFLTLSQARQRATEIKDSAARGIEPKPASRPSPPAADTLQAIAERFMDERARAGLRSAWPTERALRRELLAALGDRPVVDITRQELREVFNAIRDRGAGRMANRVFSIAKTFFGWAVENEILPASPMADLKRPVKSEASRDRVLSDGELARVWHAVEELHPPRRDCVRMLALCGTRRNETAAMRWDEIDLARREWTIPASMTKNKITHCVYLSDQALAVINAQRDRVEGCEYVFSYDGRGPITNVSTYFARLAQKLDLDIRVHDLRRSFASGLQRLGVQPVVIDKCLNHSSVIRGVAAVYLRASYADERRAAMASWGKHVAGLLSPEPGEGRAAA
jgi:integrase